MIRGPVLPLQRDGLWRLVSQRPDLFERGLRVVAEALDLGTEGLGLVDGLIRDASGGAVLVFTTDDRDPALPARVVAAHAFWSRNAAGMPRALPEADLRESQGCRLLVLGTGLAASTVVTLERLQLAELEIVEVDTFQVGGQERLVVRPVRGPIGAAQSPPIDGSIGAGDRAMFAAFDTFLHKLDPKIRIEGDRFSRRASLEGRPLGDCWYADERVLGSVPGGSPQPIQSDADVRALGDQIARRYLMLLGEVGERTATRQTAAAAGSARTAAPPARGGFEALRASLSAARLSADESCALSRPEEPGRTEHPGVLDGDGDEEGTLADG